ncbi:hypothetical protein GCM10010339_63550 [Streptomyces alanosinicus]|uniref:Uncharacterized protein n=1 Tax=Streptomyces alanosinicus TaxID=68171 RepID=A0A918YQB1_9ACTN|nr:hypothetical protein GCM10010339_63550 [Streptomyces alanosinicus]
MHAVAATLGTMTTANRFHLVPPRTWDSIFPPSRTYISWPGIAPVRGSARQGWEKCYVLGKENARARGSRTAPESPAITPERQPLVAPDTHHAQPCWTGFAGWAKTPLPESRRHCRRLCPVGTQSLP